MAEVQVRKYDYDEMATRLFEELYRKPHGLDMEEIRELFDVSRDVASKVITTLRIALGEGDSIAVPIIIEGNRHIYKLAGSRAECMAWLLKRARYDLQKVRTEIATYRALASATDGRTTEGKLARQTLIQVTRLEEDLTAYLNEVKV